MLNKSQLIAFGGVIIAFLLGYIVCQKGLFSASNTSTENIVQTPVQEEKKPEVKEEDFREVSFCDEVYKVKGDILIIDGIDVAERIAEIASANQGDYVCNNIKINTPDGILDVEVKKQSPDATDYKPNSYSISMQSTFEIDGNKIYKVSGLGADSTFYGNLR